MRTYLSLFALMVFFTGYSAVPSKPDLVTFDGPTSTSITIHWTAPADNGSSILSYSLEQKEGSGGTYTEIYSGLSLSFASTMLTAGTTYYFRLKANNGDGDSPYSDEAEYYLMKPFITTWKTDSGIELDPQRSNNDQIRIQTTGSGYSYTVEWGNGEVDFGVTGDIVHTYPGIGTYTVKITGQFPRIYFNSEKDYHKILTIEQWGDLEWSSFEKAFWGCMNLTVEATDAPDLSNVTNLSMMFQGCSSFNSDISNWQVGTITSLLGTFFGASSFNQDISGWNVSSVTNMQSLFSSATNFNQDISNWNVGNVTTMYTMFANATAFDQNLDNWNFSAVTSMVGMFEEASSFDQDLGDWEIGNVLDMTSMLLNSGLSIQNYDNTLEGWAAQTLKPNVQLGAYGISYCGASAARATLTDSPNNWTISDSGLKCRPSKPASVTFGEGFETSFIVNWTAPTANGATITSYTLEQKTESDGTFNSVYSGTNLTHTATGLTNGNNYYFRLKATNSEGDSDWSDEAYKLKQAIPSKPNKVSFGLTTETSVVVNWTTPADNGNIITSYSLEQKVGFGGSYSEIYSGTDLSTAVTGLATESTYYFKVRATNAGGKSAYSDETSFNFNGTGTPQNPYKIATVSQLDAIREDLGASYLLMNDLDLSQESGDLSGQYWNSGSGWEPIGNYSTPFTGSLDGGSYSISGLFIDRSSTDYVGLFGYISNTQSIIEDLNLSSVDINGNSRVGAIAGELYRGKINNCTTSGIVSANRDGAVSGNSNVGGITGLNSATIQNTTSSCSVEGYNSIGGAVGVNYGTISSCHVTGAVSGTTGLGGLVGINSSTGIISSCYATGDISGTVVVTSNGGGLVGSNQGAVSDCYATGEVVGGGSIGGFVGNNSGTIARCFSMGTVDGTDLVGGFGGQSSGTLQDAYALGEVTGNNWVGGFAGSLNASINPVSRIYSAGKIVGITNIGGLTGSVGGSINDSFWNSETSGQVISKAGDGTRNEKMVLEATFTNWDFETVWDIDEGNSYPFLRSNIPDSPPHLTSINGFIAFEGGNGTSSNPLHIATPTQLNEIRNYLPSNFKLINDIDLTSETGSSSGTFWNGGAGWNPIVCSNFNSGSLDGNSFVITGLTINRPATDKVGFFSTIANGGALKNLKFQDVTISGNNGVGTLIGEITSGAVLITSCEVEGSISGNWMVGGLIGEGKLSSSSVKYSSFSGSVEGSLYIGGILGNSRINSVQYSFTNVEILNSSSYKGGIVGINYETSISDCYSAGKINGYSTIGGITGYNGGSISRVYSVVEVTGTGALGGLVGQSSGGTVTNSYWDTDRSIDISFGGGEGKTTAELLNQTTFTTWDFSNIWLIDEDQSYPYLKWKVNPESFNFPPPVPDVELLADITGQCEVNSSDVTIPTASNTLSESIDGTTDVIFPVTTQGESVITWAYQDSKGNITTQTQRVLIDDTIVPVPDLETLADVSSECSVNSVEAPTATDNCSGTLTGTTSQTFPITNQGTTTITWTFDDGNGNSSTQTQKVIIDDVTNPVPDLEDLELISSECSMSSVEAPTAVDNCAGAIVGTTDQSFPITSQGTTIITWTFDDGNGNTITQLQTISIEDASSPVPDLATLPDVKDECSIEAIEPPTAADNCSGSLSASTDQIFPINDAGLTVITWVFDDGNGNVSQLNQNVILTPVTIWYVDADGDGYGDASSSLTQCDQPQGYVLDNTDCEDTDGSLNPETIWYLDSDGDGFGNEEQTLLQCIHPLNYVLISGDCDDSDPSLNPEKIWYLDQDGDGYGDVNHTIGSCSQPEGYVALFGDCDDTYPEINPVTVWYADADSDGFGDAESSRVQCTQPDGYVLNSNDCDDSDGARSPETIWYADADQDSFGDENVSLVQCVQPGGYVLNKLDCDDSDPSLGEIKVWYLDSDEDGFGDPTEPLDACSQPSTDNGILYVSNSDDCDDTNPLINPNSIWYADTDGDGYGDSEVSLIQCSQPTGYVLDGTDCDDQNPDAHPDAVWYADVDEDGFGNESEILIQCTQPMGYVSIGGDCDDADPETNPLKVWYYDADLDGFGSSTSQTVSQCEKPDHYVSIAGDCNELSPLINPDTEWYADQDGDGFGDSNTITNLCTQPSGFVNNSLDCDDTSSMITINGTQWYADLDGDGYGNGSNQLFSCPQPEGYIKDFSDCDDTDPDINPATVWYLDEDGDGFGNLVNTKIGCDPGSNYVKNSTDCNDSNNKINPSTIWYLDSDGDGFGDPTKGTQVCAMPSDGLTYVINPDDCNDSDITLTPNTKWHQDSDGDGLGNPLVSLSQCSQPDGYVLNTNDCDDQNPVPTLDLGADFTVCRDEYFTLIGEDGFASYFWEFPNGGGVFQQTLTVVYTISGSFTYTLLVTTSSGCTTTDQITVHVNDFQAPVFTTPGTVSICPGSVYELDEYAGVTSYVWSDGSFGRFFTPVQAGDYTLTLSTDEGCETTRIISFDFFDIPEVNLGEDRDMCEGAELMAPVGFSHYQWNTGSESQSIQIFESGTFIVSATTVDACIAVDTVTIGITPAATASFDYQIDKKTVSFSNSSVGDEIHWEFGDGGTSVETNPTHFYEHAGEYTVVLNVLNLCNQDIFSSSISIEDEPDILGFDPLVLKIFPNPTNQSLHFSNLNKTATFRVIDLSGKEMIAGMLKDQIDVRQLPAGIYLFEVKTIEGTDIFRFIKQ